ncbi:DUF6799 domain-containing protein [Adhaeribacter terreus]|uniref:DUF6799 domain-containing protein n=1 Tax=Adhaeribacter terreus TaxID=529703 RepID=A0ABW0EFF9_9BACT
MKKLFSLLFALLLTGSFVQAQTSETTTKVKAKGAMSENQHMQNPAMKDGIMMQGGKLMMVNNGVAAVITEDQTLSNGMMVMKDGNVKMTDGSTMMLHDGDHLTMEGKIMHHHPNMHEAGPANKSKGHSELGKTKMKHDDETGKMKNGKPAKSKLKSSDEKMKMKNNKGESKTKYDE